ncbi:hypothetical protein JX265_008408 [Neoarthrinium moseri]|uniref:Structural maintenance of chromosomes protein 5 n=1 Tax=Neoarthrinium moseri TaxID=1658444 RepID=A0A9P9WI70_9PEZI|nr:hypothetical protein JX266_008800 [Neoarthrinium moseri]KAI1864684.1 hypothetical protein JX265_008408 [Neoarthrinium moseri]
MPAAPSRRRSRSAFEADGEAASSSGAESQKRLKRSASHDEEDGEADEDDEYDDDPFAPTQRTNGLPNGSHGSGETTHSPGAVVRVKLVNFVTYENAVFYPGPHLNMIIGPNGTGKSSLVCALALGLGYNTSVLGRATKFGEYVTHGRDTATVEIELQRRPREKKNHVIRLDIIRENDKRKFWLNGKPCLVKVVQGLVANLRIACDNLCQFLPQEKVAEFAGLTPVQLLHETLRAAAPEEVINWQTALKALFIDFKDLKARVETQTANLTNLQSRQQGLQADVDRLNEREAIKNAVEDMRKARLCAEYNEARIRTKAETKKRKDAEKRLKALEQACGPGLEAVNDKEAYKAKVGAVLDHRKRALKTAESNADQAFRTVESLGEQIKECQNNIEQEKQLFTAKKAAVGKLRQTITRFEAEYKNEPPHFNAADWNQKIREQEHVLRDLVPEKRQIQDSIGDIKLQGRQNKTEIDAIQQNINSLNSQQGQKISFLKRFNPEVYQGWEWLQENQDKFEKEVFGPPMLTCSLKDERYSDLIQSMLQANDFLCFTCQTRKDHKTLSEKFYKDMGLSITIRTCGTDFRTFQPPMPVVDACRLGLDGYAIDFMDGPEPVLAMLCSERFLHASGVALEEISSEQFDALQNSQRINTWATGQTFFRVIRRREYGPDATTTSTRKVNQGRFWTDQPIDNQEMTDLQGKLNEATERRRQLLESLKDAQAKVPEIEEKESTVQKRLDELKNEKSELQAAHSRWVGIPDKIEAQKRILDTTRESMQACKARVAELDTRSDELLVEKGQAVLKHKEAVSQIRDAYQSLLDVQIRLIEASSDVRGLKERNSEITRSLEEKKEEIKAFAHNAAIAKREAEDAKQRVTDMLAQSEEGNDDFPRYQAMIEEKTLSEIDHEIQAEEAKLELIHAVDPGVLRQFEKRAKDIEELVKDKEKSSTKLGRLEAQIKELMEKFEPKIDELIAKVNQGFGHNFDMISCAGEVNIHKDDDFEQWAIEIKVKFREHEELQLLNQHRQSGGERAVSTVFYIMALQSMAQAPFRVVDEINQGMDPRNERMVHERMVEIACREHTSQYFLITPKLLTGLRYDERMRVLCIASGENVPETAVDLDFGKLITKQLALKAAA